MAKRLYVGNLSYSVNDQILEQKFAEFGTVESARIITDRDSGRSKGFGFVEMESDEAADQAIESLNGQDWEGRKVLVSEARERAPGGGGGPRRGGFGGGGGGGGGGRGGFGGGGGGGRGGFGGGGGGGRPRGGGGGNRF